LKRLSSVFQQRWQARSPYRLPDLIWRATLSRVRSEFDEMPCLRVTEEQARILFGLPEPASGWVLKTLASEGFLMCTSQGEYLRRSTTP
jgi:hypothetical protein